MQNIDVTIIGSGYGVLCAIKNVTTPPDTSIRLFRNHIREGPT